MGDATGGSRSRKQLWVTLLALVVVSFLPPYEAFGQSSTPILVELFTSEGCSSCPPADAFLRVLDQTQPIAGARLIVLEEHVDYWDDQGWKDPFSLHACTLRQREYEERLHVARGPYTPQMVVDGSYELVGSDRGGAREVFAKARATPKITVEISSFKISQGEALAHVATSLVPSKAEIIAAIALDQAESEVRRGENQGRHLEHVAVLHDLVKIGQVKKGQSFSKDVSFHVDPSRQSYRLITLVEDLEGGKIIGAALARLPQ